MRPQVLFPLFAPQTSLKGVGARMAPLLEKLTGGAKLVDLLWHLPSGVIDRRYAPNIADAIPHRVATLTVHVHSHMPGHSRKQPYKVICSDETGFLTLVFFHARSDYLAKILPIGETRVVSGTVEVYGQERQMAHPDHVEPEENRAKVETVEPTYPLTAGITQKPLQKAIRGAMEVTPLLPEWIDPALKKREKWPDWFDALTAAHHPEGEEELDPFKPARARLAYDELLSNQLALVLMRQAMRELAGRAIRGDGSLRKQVRDTLPFALTKSQETSLAEIDKDLSEPIRMLRLLQGDVGSGKTVVALLTMLSAVETGAQAALMAPTEILARQHLATITPLAEAAGVTVTLLTGREKGKTRAAILESLASGSAQIAIGTHALFQEGVEFRDLAVAVIDEQHRFGVHQRLELASKGNAVDVLVMTATPIPRTLTLTAYGDMDVSRLTEKPAGRKPIKTIVKPLSAIDDVTTAVGRAMQAGNKVYWVCPLVEESEELDVAAVEERHQDLTQYFGPNVGLVHGKMKGKDKDAAMEAFAEGPTNLLVATTVIEVGVDVPEATVMVIEHAERFGLAQLHQLRGRIGRGDRPSTCLLLYAPPLTDTARKRLEILRETEDGFLIAEEDLKLRGAGELLGTRQSGLPDFRLADFSLHHDLIPVARDDARKVLTLDPGLESERGKALKTLLYLFEQDAAVRYLRSG